MPGRSVDLVASGPPPLDPYDPAASAWAVAGALAAAGDSVRVLHVPGTVRAPVPTGVEAVPVEIPLRRPGAPVEPAEFAAAAGRRLRKPVDLVFRDPLGLGPLGTARGRRGLPVVGGFVREIGLRAFEAERKGRESAGVVDRLDSWRDHRAVRRLERAALQETDRLFYDAPEVAKSLGEEYEVPARKLVALPPAVASLAPLPTRDESRSQLRIPPDVPVVLALAAFDTPEPSGVDRVLEAFRRARPFFPGARLLLWGVPASSDPGVVSVPDRRFDTLAIALASADVAVFARRVAGFDPGMVLAARAGVPPIVLPDARLPVDPAGGVRVAASDDPGDLASVVAELLADPASRRTVGAAAAHFAEPFAPERVAAAACETLAPRVAV
jgi:hypothetical protein